MNIKKILAALMSVLLIALTFAACSSKEPPENGDATETPPETLVISGSSTEEVTAITGTVDKDGNVIDNEGIVDKEGHKIYYTGHDTEDGKKIYTTGKKDANGNILYTLNMTDDRGNLIYYTGKEVNGKLELDRTNAVPDYTTNENSTLNTNSRYTSTSTVKYDAPDIKDKASDIKKSFMTYSKAKGDDTFKKVIPAQGGGFIAITFSMTKAGLYEDVNKSWADFANIVKFSDKGEIEWIYNVGGDGQISLDGVAQLKDGSIVAVGYTLATDTDAPMNSLLTSSLIVKVSEKGEYIWSYSFPGDENSNGDYLVSVCATPDGGFVAGGRADSTAGFFNGTQSDHFKAFLFKFDKNGEVEWRKTLTGSRGNTFEAVDTNEDGDIFALCTTLSNDGSFTSFKGYNNQTANTVVLKFDKKGNLQWSKNLMSSGLSKFTSVDATKDGGCIVGGTFSILKRVDGSFQVNYGGTDGYVVKYNKDGGVCWARNVAGAGDDEVAGVAETENGIVIVGRTKSNNLDFSEFDNIGDYDGFVMIVDNAGKTICTNKIAGKGTEYMGGVAATEGGFAVVGWTNSNDTDFSDNPVARSFSGFCAKYDYIIK